MYGLSTCVYSPLTVPGHLKTVMQQTLLFFAAARYGEDDEAAKLGVIAAPNRLAFAYLASRCWLMWPHLPRVATT